MDELLCTAKSVTEWSSGAYDPAVAAKHCLVCGFRRRRPNRRFIGRRSQHARRLGLRGGSAYAAACLAALTAMLAVRGTNSAIPNDGPILRRVMTATDVTDVLLAQRERIVVYDQEPIEIRFAFGDRDLLCGT